MCLNIETSSSGSPLTSTISGVSLRMTMISRFTSRILPTLAGCAMFTALVYGQLATPATAIAGGCSACMYEFPQGFYCKATNSDNVFCNLEYDPFDNSFYCYNTRIGCTGSTTQISGSVSQTTSVTTWFGE